MKRNGYIDIIKFILAIMIMDFHFGSGLLRGGYLAVEGFFMVSGFFMMKSLEKTDPSEPTGESTVKFMFRKYKGLLPMLFVSAVIGFVVYIILKEQSAEVISKNLWLLMFEIFPLQTAGFKGYYVVGISWYLSSMFIALAILFPFAKKYKRNFVLVICPLITILGYGILCANFGMLGGVGKSFIKNTVLQTGIIRAISGCSLGCIINEIIKLTKNKEFTRMAKIVFTALEFLAFAAIVKMMHFLPNSNFDFVVVVLLFGMLIIGISGISYTSKLWNPKWTKHFGTASTLIVLNHCYWCNFIKLKLSDWGLTEKALIYIALVTLSCIVVYILSRLLSFGTGKLLKKELWIK